MHVDGRLASSQLGDHGGQHGQESEEGEEGKEDSQEEKEVTVRLQPHGIRIASESVTLRNTDGRQLSPTEYPRNSQAGPLCRWLLHNGPAFHWASRLLIGRTAFARDDQD
jgi:hypothetical protein